MSTLPPTRGRKSASIPRATIRRLAMYVQVLEAMDKEGTQVISSGLMAKACGLNPSQIRKDLAYFGEFGVRGVGYYVQDLIAAIKQSVGVHRTWNLAMFGTGNLGRALLNYAEFKRRGFHIVAAFDSDPTKIGQTVSGVLVQDPDRMPALVRELDIEVGVIATPAESAQLAADHIVEAGIRAILNFASARITAPDGVQVEYVDLFNHFYALAFNLTLDQQARR